MVEERGKSGRGRGSDGLPARVGHVAEQDQRWPGQIDMPQGGGVGRSVASAPSVEPGQSGPGVEKDEPIVLAQEALEAGGSGSGDAGAEGAGEVGGGHGDAAAGAQYRRDAVEGGVGHGDLRVTVGSIMHERAASWNGRTRLRDVGPGQAGTDGVSGGEDVRGIEGSDPR